MASRTPKSGSPEWLWPIPAIGTVVGATVWGSIEVADSPAFERLLLWMTLSLILVAVGWLVYRAMRIETGDSEPSLLETPLRLAHDDEIFKRYQEVSRSLLRISWRNDPIYRELALQQLASASERLHRVAQGEITYRDTEVWRLAYEQLLRSPGLFQYRSVSWMTTDSYWQDEPGRQSLKLNLELHESQQITVERIVILKDSDWLNDGELPTSRIRQWIHEQHVHSIWIALVRESQLRSEPELLADFGIYGSRAVGFQQIGEQAKTKSFVLQFDFKAIEAAEARWQRLQVYATSYADLLDHFPLDD